MEIYLGLAEGVIVLISLRARLAEKLYDKGREDVRRRKTYS